MKHPILMVGLAALVLAGCSAKDKEYYLKNIEKAHEKKTDCDMKWEEAGWDSDTKTQDEISKDTECVAAKEAIQEYEKQQIIEQNKSAYEQAYQEIESQYGQLDWMQFATAFNNVYKGILLDEMRKTKSGEIDWLYRYDAVPQAWSELYRSKINAAKAELIKLPTDQLRAQESQYCSTDKRAYSACDVWQQALSESYQAAYQPLNLSQAIDQYQQSCQLLDYASRDSLTCDNLRKVIDKKSESELVNLSLEELEKEYIRSCGRGNSIGYTLCSNIEKINKDKSIKLIEQYVADANLLKKDYNECVTRIQALNTEAENLGYFDGGAEKKQEANYVAKSYPCSQVQVARRQLGLGYEFNELMP